MRQRRPLLGLLAAAILIPLTGIVATSAQAATPTLRDPVKREIAQEIITSAENSVLDWYNRYDYIEDIGDGRGYTGGFDVQRRAEEVPVDEYTALARELRPIG